jgi:hypothetical protein
MVIGSRAAFENQLRRIGRLGVGKEAKRPDYNLVPIDVRNQQGFLHLPQFARRYKEDLRGATAAGFLGREPVFMRSVNLDGRRQLPRVPLRVQLSSGL